MLRQCIRFLEKIDRKVQASSRHYTGRLRTLSKDEINGDMIDFVSPCFVLSTGRCGTLWFTELLRLSSQVHVNHSDYPELIRHSRLAYEQYKQATGVFCEIIRATRDEFIIDAYKRGQIYVETNNRATFFAHAIKRVYPKAKFIHLVRHPGDFVRSGLSRKWYHGHSHDLGRIVKLESTDEWQTMSDVEKIAWLWNETNVYIENFLAGLSRGDYIQVKVEDLFGDPSISIKLCQFIGVHDIGLKKTAKMLKRQVNQQCKWVVGPYQTWSEDQKEQFRRQATLAVRYGYEL